MRAQDNEIGALCISVSLFVLYVVILISFLLALSYLMHLKAFMFRGQVNAKCYNTQPLYGYVG